MESLHLHAGKEPGMESLRAEEAGFGVSAQRGEGPDWEILRRDRETGSRGPACALRQPIRPRLQGKGDLRAGLR